MGSELEIDKIIKPTPSFDLEHNIQAKCNPLKMYKRYKEVNCLL